MMEFEDRLRTHLLERAAEFEVPARQLEMTPLAKPPRTRAIATTLATVMVLASVIGVSLSSGGTTPDREVPDLELDLAQTATVLPAPPERTPPRTGWSWALTPGIEATQLFEAADGTILAFGPADPVTQRGLRLWSLGSDGRLLEAHGTVLGTVYETPILQQGGRLVAVGHGSPWADQFPELTGGTLLDSADGQTWNEIPIPMVTEPPHAEADLILAGSGRALIRTTERSAAEAAAWNAVGPDYADSAFDFEFRQKGNGDVNVVIAGLNLAVDTVTVPRPVEASPPPATRFWITQDNGSWSETTMPDLGSEIEQWTGFFDGRQYVVTATGVDGIAHYLTSPDLTTWEVAGESRDLHKLLPLDRGGYLAQQDGRRRPRLFTSDDLATWEPITEPDLEQPSAAVTDAVDESLFGVAMAYANPAEPPSPFFLVRIDGLVVMFDRSSPQVVVWEEEDAFSKTTYPTREPNPAIQYSTATDALLIEHPTNGGTFIELPAEEVMAALQAEDLPAYSTSMMFATDEEHWKLTNFTTQTGGDGPVQDVLVTDRWVFIAYGPSENSPAQVWAGHPFSNP